MLRSIFWFIIISMTGLSCQSEMRNVEDPPSPEALLEEDTSNKVRARIREVAASKDQWTGVTVSAGGRMFVNFPRWDSPHDLSVAELVDDQPQPYPDASTNSWSGNPMAQDAFICVQSVVADGNGHLWVLDPANPQFSGVVAGGARLHRIDLNTDQITRTYFFPDSIAPRSSYLNDLRVDTVERVAYITDSGLGALVVVDLQSGAMRRVLDQHPSTQATLAGFEVGNYKWEAEIHSDGIALAPDRKTLFYHALSGHTLYAVPTELIRDFSISSTELSAHVTEVAQTAPTDGMVFDQKGNLYLGALTENAVCRLSALGRLDTLIADDRIRWADTFTRGPNDAIYFTTSQIHIPPEARAPYKIFELIYPVPDEESIEAAQYPEDI